MINIQIGTPELVIIITSSIGTCFCMLVCCIFCSTCCKSEPELPTIVPHSFDNCNIITTVPTTPDNIDCTICINTTENDSVVMLSKCNHKFHSQCIHSLVNYSDEHLRHCACPNCRIPICKVCDQKKFQSDQNDQIQV